VSPVKYEMGFYIPEDDILHSHCRENLKSYIVKTLFVLKVLEISLPLILVQVILYCGTRLHNFFN
jgi:hypothetical protein